MIKILIPGSLRANSHVAMMWVLTSIGARIIEDASMIISFVRSKLDSAGKIKDEELANTLRRAVENLISAGGED